ncbi:MAG: C40 family peptidase [Mobilitalea sp.]
MNSKKVNISKKPVSNKVSSESSMHSSSIRNDIVNYALQFDGNPYSWGGTSLTRGADCSGFTQTVFRDKGIKIPRTSKTQAASGSKVSLDDIKPGDLIFYGKNGIINHVAIYIGDEKVISASSKSTGIRITAYNYRDPYKAVSYIDR